MFTVKSEHTKKTYQEYFRYFQNFSKMEVAKLLTKKKEQVEEILKEYIKSMRQKKLSHSSIRGRIAPILTFLELNDKVVNKRKLAKYYGEQRTTVKDKPYTTEELQKMIAVAKPRVRVMILIYSSTGIRKEAIVDLKRKHLEKIGDLYKFTIYENDKEEYITFCTPECASAIDEYILSRQRAGEIITKESPLIRNDFNQDASKPRPIDERNLNTLLRHIVIKAGLRAEGQPVYDRHEIALFHGMRKRHSTILVESGVKSECRYLLEGHALKGNDSAYVRISEKTLLQEYLKAVNHLTISDEERLKFKLEERIQIEKTQYESLKEEFEKFKSDWIAMKQGS